MTREALESVKATVAIRLAGNAAEELARPSTAAGRAAYHESGHCIAALLYSGRIPHLIRINRRGGGWTIFSPERPDSALTDGQVIAFCAACLLEAGEPPLDIAAISEQVRQDLLRHWRAVALLAEELLRRLVGNKTAVLPGRGIELIWESHLESHSLKEDIHHVFSLEKVRTTEIDRRREARP